MCVLCATWLLEWLVARRVLMLMMACAVGAMLGMWEEGGVCAAPGYDHHDDPSSINLTTKKSQSHNRFLFALTWRDRLPNPGFLAVTTSASSRI